MSLDGGKTILQHMGIVIIQNLDDISERADQQHLIQMRCLTTAAMQVLVIAFPYWIIIGGGMPILPSISATTVGAVDLVGEQGEGRIVPIRMLQPILDFRENCFGYNAWMAILNEVAGQFTVIDPLLMGDVVSDIRLL